MGGSTTTSSSKTQPALIGGLVTGVLSALPIVSGGNLCCCLWIVSGGVVAAYVLQQNQTAPITAGDGALVGLLAGLAGAVIFLVVSIPVSIIVGPYERALLERLMSQTGHGVPPNLQQSIGAFGRGVLTFLGFMFMLCAGAIFSTLGGLLGVAIFAKQRPPATGPIDAPAQ